MSENTKCTFKGCSRIRRAVATGLCSGHSEQRRLGNELTPLKEYVRGATICSAGECDIPVKASGLCGAHYRRRQRGTESELPVKEIGGAARKLCKVDNCEDVSRSLGMCRFHYHRHYNGIPLDAPKQRRGDVWSEWYLDGNGYVVRRMTITGRKTPGYKDSKRHQFQHRVVWEEAYGPLTGEQNIHHKNGNRADNRLENLELWDVRQPKGQRPEDKLEYAKEIFLKYAEPGTKWEQFENKS